jgi:hypothetical protein
MDFRLEFYETTSGKCPVREFLDGLKLSDPDDFAAVVAGLTKLRNSHYHREPLSKALGDGLFELRHAGKLNTRVLWFFMKGRRIVLLHGIRNKGETISSRDLATARLCRNATNHRDVMLSASEASVFPTPYEKQILRLRLRMTLRHSLRAGKNARWA